HDPPLIAQHWQWLLLGLLYPHIYHKMVLKRPFVFLLNHLDMFLLLLNKLLIALFHFVLSCSLASSSLQSNRLIRQTFSLDYAQKYLATMLDYLMQFW